jgi:hypothetical protein
MRCFFFHISLLAALAVSGCEDARKESGERDATPKPAGAEPPVISKAASEDFGDWEVEVFSANAGEQLEGLKEFLKGEAEATSFGQATSPGLAGFEMTTVFKGGSFGVRQAKVVSGDHIALRDALDVLRKRFADQAATLVEIKIVHVDLTESSASTELHVHLADETLQVNAIWDAKWSSTEQPILNTLETRTYEECERTGAAGLVDSTGFVLGAVPEVEQVARGIDHWVERIETFFGIEVGGWHGISVADVNGDGLDDLAISDGGGLLNRLLIQQADGSVRDHSRESGMGFLDHTYGTLFVDLDNDGDQDAALSTIRGVLILENDGTGKFTAREGKIFPAAAPYTLTAADYDQDGDLDLYACCYVRRSGADRHSFVARPVPYHDAINGGRNELLRNEGGLHFRIVTKSAGLEVGNSKFSYSGTWDDYDGDGDLDLYVANDFGGNHLYQNQLVESGQPVFKDVAEAAGVRDVAAGMSACWGDYDNDGRVDLYVGNMFSSAGNRIAFQDRFKAGRDAETWALYQRHTRGNSLFRNAGNGTFEDVSIPSGTTMGRWAWSSLFADINNDGWEDLLVTNGFITQEDPGDL